MEEETREQIIEFIEDVYRMLDLSSLSYDCVRDDVIRKIKDREKEMIEIKNKLL